MMIPRRLPAVVSSHPLARAPPRARHAPPAHRVCVMDEGHDIAPWDDRNEYISTPMTVMFGDICRVVLIDSGAPSTSVVARKLKRAVPMLDYATAVRVADLAATHGSAIVMTVPKIEATVYERRLRRQGLRTTITPA